MYKNENLVVCEKNIFEKSINELTKEELNFYKLFCFFCSSSIPLQKEELKMYLENNLIKFERISEIEEFWEDDEDGFPEEKTRKVDNIYFYINGKKNSKVCILDFYDFKDNAYRLKEDAPTNLDLKVLSIDEKSKLIIKNLFRLSWSDSDYEIDNYRFSNGVRNAYRKLFSYEDIMSILNSFNELGDYIKDDIKEFKDYKSLKQYLIKESFSGLNKMTIRGNDGLCEIFDNHGYIEVYSRKKRKNDIEIAKIKKAYEKGIISLCLDSENIVGFEVKNLKNIVTDEKINDIFSIDFFRYDAPENLLGTSDVNLVKTIYSVDEISEMIYESIIVCFEDIRNSIFEKIK